MCFDLSLSLEIFSLLHYFFYGYFFPFFVIFSYSKFFFRFACSFFMSFFFTSKFLSISLDFFLSFSFYLSVSTYCFSVYLFFPISIHCFVFIFFFCCLLFCFRSCCTFNIVWEFLCYKSCFFFDSKSSFRKFLRLLCVIAVSLYEQGSPVLNFCRERV
jgi:hypothetical protein